MKIKKIIFYIFMFLPLAAALILLPCLPEQIPAHYGIDNQADRWGSKYEALLLPVITALAGLLIVIISKYAAKREKAGQSNEGIFLTAGILTLMLFNAITGYFLCTAFNRTENLSSSEIDINQFITVAIGLLLIAVGSIMPKLRMNSFIGLRTVWSMKNERAWERSQRFGGISFIAAGAVAVAAGCFAKGFESVLWLLGALLILLPVDIYYTYIAAKESQDK